MRERVTVVTLSVTLFSILEKAPFSGLKLTSVYVLARDLLARRTLYQFTKAIICVVPALVSSLRVVAGLQTAFLSNKL